MWYPDTRTTNNITPDLSNLSLAATYSGADKWIIGNGNGLRIELIGLTILNSKSPIFHLHNILYVPFITKLLFSI